MDRYHYYLVSFIIIVVVITLNIVHAESTTKVVKYPLDWEFYLKYNPDLIQAGINTKDRAIEHYHNFGEKEKRWHHPDDQPSFDACDRAKDILNNNDFLNETTNSYRIYCKQLLKLKLYDSNKWKGIGNVASWKYSILYDMYMNEIKPLKTISSSNKLINNNHHHHHSSPLQQQQQQQQQQQHDSKVCFIVKPSIYAFETIRQKKARLSQNLYTLDINQFITSLLKQTNILWEAYFILTTKQIKYHDQLLQTFNNIGNNDYRLFTHITSDHNKNSNIGSSSSSSSASSNSNTAGGSSGSSTMMNHDESSTNSNINNDNINNINNWIFIDHAIEDIMKQEQCRWITITTANNVYGSEIVDELLKVYTSSQKINHDQYQNASTTTTSTTTGASEQFDNDYNNNNDNDYNNGKILADLSILPLDSKYYLALNSIKLNETNNANDRCNGIDSMMNIYYRAYTSQPIIIPGRIFLDSIFFSRQKLNKYFIPFNLFMKNISSSFLSSYNSIDNNNQNFHDTFSSSSSQPCYFHCHEGEYIQYLTRNQNWKYLRYPLGGLSTTIFHGPFSPTYCIASKNVWLDNIDLDNIACYPHDTIANIYELKDNPLVVERSIMDWKHYDQSERICLRLSEVGNKVAIIQSKSKHLYFHKNNKTRLNHNYKNKLLTSISTDHKDNRHNNNNINYLNHNGNYIINNIINNNMNDENLNNLLRKLITYKENLMKFVKHYDANLSNLIIYDIQSITSSSMKSKEVIMNNIQIFASSIIENNYNLDVSAASSGSDSQQPYLFYIIIVDSIDLNLISHYIPSYYDNVYLLVTTTASSSSSSRSSSSPWVIMSNTHDHSIEKQLYVLNHIFNNKNNKNKQITLNDFCILYFLSTNSRGPLSLRKNNKWMNKFSYIFEKFPQISMISTTAAIPRQVLLMNNNISTSFDFYNNNDYSTYLHLLISLLSPYSSLPINIDTFAMKSSKILLTILQRYLSIYSYYLSTLHNDGSSSSIYSPITSEHYDKHNINHENHFKSNTSSNLSSKQYYLLLKSMLIETIYSSNSKISSLLHYTRTNNLYYEYDPVVKQTSQLLLSSSSLQSYNDEYILSYRIPSMWNLSSWCRIYPNEIIFLRYGGEHLGLNAQLDGYECSNSISTTGDNFKMMSKSMLDFHHQYPFVNLILPESPIGGILYNLYYDNSQQLWNTLNLQQRVQQYVNITNNRSSRGGSSSSYSSIDNGVSKDNNNQIPSKVCIIVRTTANHDRKRNRENEKFPYYEMDLQGLIKSLYWQSNLNWEAYFLVTDHSKFEIRLNEILNEYKLLFNDINRLHYVEIPSEYLPSYTSKDAGYTATDYVLKKILKFPQCKWISFTNGDNAYGANIIDNTLKARLSIGSASVSSNDDKLIPQMILQPFSSRNLIQKIYSERNINDNDYKKKCIYLEAMMDHTLLAVAAQPYPGVGSVDLASIFIHSKDFIKENIYFSTFSNTGCNGCQDGLLASKLKERGWKYMRLPLDGLKSTIYHGPSELLCIAEGNVWVDFPHNNQVGCITHEIAAKFREEDMMSSSSSSSSSSSDEDSKRWKFDWNHFDHSERICLRITAYGKDHIHL